MFDIDSEIQETRVRLCLDCGKCTVVCPVAQCDPDFNPRLIVQRRLGMDGSSPDDETIWSCVNCYMCVERCNYRVGFPEFVNALRWEARSKGYQVQCAHGGALQALMHLMARPDLIQDRLGWLPPDIEVSSESDTVFFVGCAPYFDVIFEDLGARALQGTKGALRLLNRAGIPFRLLDNERCCGHDLLLQGDREGFAALARANIDELSRHGVRRVIVNCPEGYHTLKREYPAYIGGFDVEVVHLTELLAPLVESGKLELGGLETRVTYHDPCMLGRCSGLYDEPRTLLQGVSGLRLAEMEQNREKALCCGASPWAHCGAVNRQIQEKRLSQAAATGAEVMVTACPKCRIHLSCAQQIGAQTSSQVPIEDLFSLLARSLD